AGMWGVVGRWRWLAAVRTWRSRVRRKGRWTAVQGWQLAVAQGWQLAVTWAGRPAIALTWLWAAPGGQLAEMRWVVPAGVERWWWRVGARGPVLEP
ncbi:hypothetical protein, partial [Devosia sp.]|uniref:hypothetical protein n=1 Tax=Devosia sp. TaxID=1871048 RepID=UPI00263765D9